MTGLDLDDTRAHARVQIDACSFDVFGTFLLRACTSVEGVFERAFQRTRVAGRHPDAVQSYVQHRIQAETHARAAAARGRHSTGEVSIEDIYGYFPFRLFGLNRMALQELVDAEFEAELDLCRVNREILNLYRDAQQSGQRVGFISNTYWGREQLGLLLRNRLPDLTWNFIYTSCESGTGKGDRLFARYLSEQRLDSTVARHVGDNENADLKEARRVGIRARYYPQASARFAAQLQRETSVFELLYGNEVSRLDQGLRTLRRVVAAQTPERSVAYQLGVTILGPVMAGFAAFVEARIAQLRRSGARIMVAFLGSDGFLSHQIWQEWRSEATAYVEIDRVILAGLDEAAGGPAEASTARKALLAELQRTIANFDSCTDLVLVGLDHTGRVQKSLRRIFDLEDITARIHGAYLVTRDDAFHDLDPDDTAEGFVSDLVVTPHVKRTLLRNVALLGQLCRSAENSGREERGEAAIRDHATMPAEQLTLIREAQAGAITFIQRARELGPQYDLQPFEALDVAARWTATMLGRLMLLPDDDELVALGSLTHEVAPGAQRVPPMLDLTAPPWLAGGFAPQSPAHAILHLLAGANKVPALADTACGTIGVGLFGANGEATLETVSCYRTGFGDLRIRVPVARRMAVRTIAVPLPKIATEGRLHGIVVQAGPTLDEASVSPDVAAVARDKWTMAGFDVLGDCYRATDEDGCLVIMVEPIEEAFVIFNIALTPFSDVILTKRSINRADGELVALLDRRVAYA